MKALFMALGATLVFAFSGNVFADSSLDILPGTAGTVGDKISLVGKDFCTSNESSIPVIISWDNVPVSVSMTPSFTVEYAVPLDADAGDHELTATAQCSTDKEDRVITTFTVSLSDTGQSSEDAAVSADTTDDSTQIMQGTGDESTDIDTSDLDTDTTWWQHPIVYWSGLGLVAVTILGFLILTLVRTIRGHRSGAPRIKPESANPTSIKKPSSTKTNEDKAQSDTRIEFEE